MRQVLELVSSLIATNPSREVALAVKSSVLKTTMAIIFHASAQPLVKPAFKSLECFLSKRTITPAALMEAFVAQNSHDKKSPIEPSWAAFFLEVFDWMTLPDTSPAAGKFCVTLFIAIERSQEPSPAGDSTEGAAWQHWIHDGLSRYPNSLESVKNHILSPLFKLDRTGSLAFLNQLNTRNDGTDANKKETGSDPLLHLAAIEVGKKSGLVEEASRSIEQLSHVQSNIARSFAISEVIQKVSSLCAPQRRYYWRSVVSFVRHSQVSGILSLGIVIDSHSTLHSLCLRVIAKEPWISILRY